MSMLSFEIPIWFIVILIIALLVGIVTAFLRGHIKSVFTAIAFLVLLIGVSLFSMFLIDWN